jgi:transposase
MMRALQPEIYDTLFRLVADRIPAPPEHPKGGCRRRIPNEVCFRGIFWRFVTGAAWETIEVLMEFQVSDTTLRSRRSEWVDAGVFDELMEHALAEYDRIVGVDVSHVMIDGSSQLAPGGGPDTGAFPGSKGRKGFKWSIGVDAAGVGLGFVLDTGGRNDYRLLQPTLDTIVDQPAVTNIGTLHLDRGYGYPSLADRVADYPIDNIAVIPRNQPGQGRIELVGFGWNWIVERTNAWLTNFRQLKINWDRTIKHRHAAVCLAFTIICLYRIINHLTATNQPLTSIR